jgi:hypothetical protein
MGIFARIANDKGQVLSISAAKAASSPTAKTATRSSSG